MWPQVFHLSLSIFLYLSLVYWKHFARIRKSFPLNRLSGNLIVQYILEFCYTRFSFVERLYSLLWEFSVYTHFHFWEYRNFQVKHHILIYNLSHILHISINNFTLYMFKEDRHLMWYKNKVIFVAVEINLPFVQNFLILYFLFGKSYISHWYVESNLTSNQSLSIYNLGINK